MVLILLVGRPPGGHSERFQQAMILRAVEDRRFRDDLLARINLWSFDLPALRARPEDIDPNIDVELRRHAEREGRQVSFNREARQRYLAFATGPTAAWAGNFRDLGASIARMATLAPSGRITEAVVIEEVARLAGQWRAAPSLSAAGRMLFPVSRAARAAPNDADRLRKYLARFGLDWAAIKAATPQAASAGT